MTDRQLDQILKRAACSGAAPASLGSGIMARVRVDDGRARRWRVFIQLMMGAALLAGVLTAISIGWALAARDETHNTPPAMRLFGEEPRP